MMMKSQCFRWSSKFAVIHQALLIHYSAKNFQTIWHVLSITALCMRFSRFKLLCNLFGKIHIVDKTNGTIQTAFSCYIFVSSSFRSVYFLSLLDMILQMLRLLGIPTSIKYASFVVMPRITISGLFIIILIIIYHLT